MVWIRLVFLVLVLGIGLKSSAQRAWLMLTDKGDEKNQVDQPVADEYLQSLPETVEVIGTSKWVNAIYSELHGVEVDSLLSLPFIYDVRRPAGLVRTETRIDTSKVGDANRQLDIMNLKAYHAMGHTGKGVKVGVFDGGFFKVDSFPLFDSLRLQNRIVAHKDFHRDSPLNFRENSHGMSVLSLMAGLQYDSLVGAAPHASYLLARTEVVFFEKHDEEFYWVRAMEWADSFDVDIIHSSLGYSTFDTLEGSYSYEDMDGATTIITQAAEVAAAKGIFVTNSAGNEGDDPWRYITAPCDGEHVLCVGAVDSFGIRANFSSVGPTADGRIKPDVMGMGRRASVLRSDGRIRTGSGTSFSGPLVAGLVACLKGAHPEASNDQLFRAILMSSSQYESPDTLMGYGIPDAIKADSILRRMALNTSQLSDKESFRLTKATQKIMSVYLPQPSVVEVRALSGRTVYRGSHDAGDQAFDLGQVAKGIYVVQVITPEALWIKKINISVSE